MSSMQYIGARYVPIVYTNPDDGSANWKDGVTYESMTVVTYDGDSYTSKKAVPDLVGNPADNHEYWVKTGDFNASLLSLQHRVRDIEEQNGTDELLTHATTFSGSINEIFADKANIYSNVNAMRNDAKLIAGMSATTNGYYAANDGGGAVYKILDTAPDGYYEELANGLYAELISDVINIKQYGAYANGVDDDMPILKKAMEYGKTIYFPSGEYLFTTRLENETLFNLIGYDRDTTIIKVNCTATFSECENFSIKNIRFENILNSDCVLINNLEDSPAVNLYKCYFKDFTKTIYAPTYSNGCRIIECYFRHGVTGLYLNVCHEVDIEKCVFWQQSSEAIYAARGDSVSITQNNFAATHQKPATMHIFSCNAEIHNNYYEAYKVEGNTHRIDKAILIETNFATLLPNIHDNAINGKDITDYGISVTGTQDNTHPFIIEKNAIQGCTTQISVTPRLYKNISYKYNSDGKYITGEMNYKSVVTMDLTGITAITAIPIDSGVVFDDCELSNDDNTIKPVLTNELCELSIEGVVESTGASGFTLDVRGMSGVFIRTFDLSFEDGYNALPLIVVLPTPVANNERYRFAVKPIADTPMPTSFTGVVKFKRVIH